MTMEMRELHGDDLFTLLGIFGKLDIKDELVALFSGDGEALPEGLSEEEKAQEIEKRGVRIVAELLQKVLINIKVVKTDINGLFADLTGATVVEIQQLSLGEYTKLLVAFFKKEELKDFFASLASLTA